jgi:tRNA 2-thiocytidine biosynthesis protein TtcA
VFTAIQNILPSHLADNAQFDFRGLTLTTPVEEGDIAFDPPEIQPSRGLPIGITGLMATDDRPRPRIHQEFNSP